jgi:hypothetical protein
MSFCCSATTAANNAVIPPVHATTSNANDPGRSSRKYTRHNMYTPAATIVAACINALTGVGPSIASGNQTCSGNCADLPTAPQKISSPATVASPPRISGRAKTICFSSSKLSVPSVDQRNRIPRRKPKSPIRFVRKAFFPASAAAGRPNQNPISR